MNTPKTIYIGQTIWSEEKIHDHSLAYFSEEAVRGLLREEYKQANYLIKTASKIKTPITSDFIDVETSINSAINRLKGVLK